MAVTLSLSITQNSQNITNNTSNVTVRVTAKWTYGSYNAKGQCYGSITIDGTKYSFSGMSFNTSATTSGSQVVMTKTVKVSHKSDGSKTLSCSASFYTGVSSGTISASGSKVLTTIPRKSGLTASNGTLGTAQTLTVDRKSTSFTHTITYKCGTASGTICTKSSNTSVSWTPPLSLASQNTTGTSVSVVFTITTYNGNTSIGSNTKTITCAIPASVKPSCSISAVTDAAGYKNTYGAFIKGLSKFSISVVPVLSYGSPIHSYRVTADGSTYTKATVTTDVLKSSGSLKITAMVTDKRGRSSDTVSGEVTVLDYVAPVINNLTVYRSDINGNANSSGAYLTVKFSAVVTSLNDKNSATYIVYAKRADSDEYTSYTQHALTNVYAVTNHSMTFAADADSSYNIMVTVSDDFNDISKTATGSSVKKVWSLLKKGREIVGAAIGKIAELENVFDIAFQTRFSGGILHPVLEPETDLNDIRTPNTYVGANISNYNYANCPLTSGTFTLEVVGMGEDGQVKQRLTYCHKTDSRVWERIYYSSAWGDWFCVSDFDGQLLWSGGYYMTAGHTVTLSELVSKQKTGIVLVFSEIVDGEAADQSFHTRFIPKMLVASHSGKAQCIQLSTSNLAYFATKYLYISDDKITGHANNNATGTSTCGITYTNNRFVLRYVIGV